MSRKIQTRFSRPAKKPYEKICCEPCWNAKGEKCVCRCGGAYHGLGAQKRPEEAYSEDFYLDCERDRPFREQIKDEICYFCGESLNGEAIRGYPHEAGWKVAGFKELLWLYIHCPKCSYDWALWKLGVPRYFPPEEEPKNE